MVNCHWGLVPHWAKDETLGNRLFNARAETVETLPSFRDAFKRGRVIVPIDAFYEWENPEHLAELGRPLPKRAPKQPWAFMPANGQRFALRSEASLRFEKGQEHRLARVGADRVAALLADWAGGSVHPGVVDTDPDDPPRTTVAFRPGRVNRLLGTALSAAEQAGLLARVGIEVEVAPPGTAIPVSRGTKPLDLPPAAEETLLAIVPTWRRDVDGWPDIVEEVVRIHGLDRVESVPLPRVDGVARPTATPEQKMERRLRRAALITLLVGTAVGLILVINGRLSSALTVSDSGTRADPVLMSPAPLAETHVPGGLTTPAEGAKLSSAVRTGAPLAGVIQRVTMARVCIGESPETRFFSDVRQFLDIGHKAEILFFH